MIIKGVGDRVIEHFDVGVGVGVGVGAGRWERVRALTHLGELWGK